jgi:putative DNA primase/helicase
MPAARTFTERFHMDGNVLALRHQGGAFYRHRGAGYQDVDEYEVRAWLYTFLEKALAWQFPKDRNKDPEPGPFKPTKPKVENLLDALRAVCNLPTSCMAPYWLEGDCKLDPYEILPCSNGLLHIPTRTLLPPSARFFTLNGLNFGYSPAAAQPTNWFSFLRELWPDDLQSQQTLQEWIGYLLTPQTSLQKICMLIGPKRSGKGTIGRVTRMLLGDRNVCGPTLSNMGEQFGLSILVGKSAAIIADARIGGKSDSAMVAERLLSISGEDLQTIPRKFLPDWNGKLSVRFMILTNELPGIEDSSGALASRFLILTLAKSFFGREDHNLLDRFIPELPGILLWALEGWDRLHKRGRFIQPSSSEQLIQTFEDLGSPIGAFVREICEVGTGFEALQAGLFQEWKSWCDSTGRRPGTAQAFARNLRAACPWLKVERPRVDGDQMRFWQGIRIRSKQC